MNDLEEEYVKDVEKRLKLLEKHERITGVALGLFFAAILWLFLH